VPVAEPQPTQNNAVPGEQLDVAWGAMWVREPDGEQGGGLEDGTLAQGRGAQPIEQAFCREAGQGFLELLAFMLRAGEEACLDRRGLVRAHGDRTSRVARSRRDGSARSMRPSSAIVVLRCRSASWSASMGASGPTRRSKRKQSAMVRAGFVIRALTPSNAVGTTPRVHAVPLNRTMRVASSASRGFWALWGIASQTSLGDCVPIPCIRSALSRQTMLRGTRAQAMARA